jgi:hypothetical protein
MFASRPIEDINIFWTLHCKSEYCLIIKDLVIDVNFHSFIIAGVIFVVHCIVLPFP